MLLWIIFIVFLLIAVMAGSILVFIRGARFMIFKGFMKHEVTLTVILLGVIQLLILRLLTKLDGPSNWLLFATLIGLYITIPFTFLYVAEKVLKPKERNFARRGYKKSWVLAENIVSILGLLSIVALVVAFARIWSLDGFDQALDTLEVPIRLLFILFPLVMGAFAYYDKIFKQKDIGEVLQEDSRAPVLFIRSFANDSKPFFGGKPIKGDMDFLVNDIWSLETSKRSRVFTFQVYFSKAFKERLGPLVGFGNPAKGLPMEGVNSSYYSDDTWEAEFIKMAESAACIITIPGNSKALYLELEYLLKNGQASKLFILTPSYTKKRFRPNKMNKLGRWVMVSEPVSWKKFAQEMTKMGYELQEEEPPKGTVLAFDHNGQQKTLITEATRPFEFVDAIKQQLVDTKQLETETTPPSAD